MILLADPETREPLPAFKAADRSLRPLMTTLDYEPRRRCSCHPAAYYGGCQPCPKCKHSSFDPLAAACERRKCGYEVPA